MPTQKERHATVLKKLQDSIQHEDPTVAAERRLYIERWVKTYIKHVEYLQNNELRFLYNVFQDENCWSGVRLNNVALGQRFAQDEVDGIKNPLYNKYNVACRYCITDRIPSLFKEQFDVYKSSFPSGLVGNSDSCMTDERIKSKLLEHMNSRDPILVFWINKESGELEKHDDPVEGFETAVRLKWNEGVEYFYNRLKKKDKKEKLTETIISLSAIQCTQSEADILDFCVSKTSDKNALLEKLSQKDNCVYSLFSRLIRWDFRGTVKTLVDDWCCKEKIPVAADRILSHRNYALFLSSLSDIILKNPEFSSQGRRIMMDLWKSDHFNEHKKAAVNISGAMLPIKSALAGLIVNWNGSDNKPDEKKEILDIISFAKDCFPGKFEFFKERIIKNLRLVGRQGMKEGVNYSELAGELFSELETSHTRGDGHSYNLRSRHKVAMSDVSDPNCKKTSLPLDGSGDHPRSTLEAPSPSSGFSGFSK